MKTPDTNPLKNKKYRSYKGKRIQRPETEREQRDRVFPGYADFKKASIGVYEDEDLENGEDGYLLDDELVDDEDDDSEDCLIPLKWAELASGNPETRKMMRKTISESRKRTKEKKKQCTPGNALHGTDGRFTSKGKKGSWSIRTPGTDCDHGQMRTTGKGNQKQWTKVLCGRRDKDNPNVKADRRCHDGAKVNEKNIDNDGLPYDPPVSAIDAMNSVASLDDIYKDDVSGELGDRLQKIIDRHPQFITHLAYLLKPMIDLEKSSQDSLVRERKKKHKNPLLNVSREQARQWAAQIGFFGWSDFLQKLAAIESAKKGTLNQKR